jgi:hypothetical protein
MNERELIEQALTDLAGRQAAYQLYRAYYDGDHRLLFASDKFLNTFGNLFQAFADNLCPAVVDSLADRLAITGWTVEGANPDTVRDTVRAIERRSRFDRVQGELHVEAPRVGDAYIVVWPDRNGTPRLHPQRGDTCSVVYDPEDATTVVAAVKVWRTLDGRVRVNAYFSDRVERYVTREKTSEIPKSLGKVEPVLDEDGPVVANPWGQVPVFHLANRAGIGEMGRSELAPVVPLQDALNKSIADMLVGSEFHSLPQRVRIGVETRLGPDGRPLAPKVAPGTVWDVGVGGDVKDLPAANLGGFLDAQTSFRTEIAHVSRTPLHLLGLVDGQYPSGEALRVAERPLADKVSDRQMSFYDAWAGAMSLALRMAGVDGVAEPEWLPAESVAMTERLAQAEAKLRVGYSRRAVLIELGETPETADAILADAAAEKAQDVETAATLFDRGIVS